MRHLIISLVIVAIAQSLAYLQLQSQFFWTWAKDHPLMMSLFGLPISILLIYFTNILRIAFIVVALYKYPQFENILHNIVFPSLIYGMTFLLWVLWVSKFSKLKK